MTIKRLAVALVVVAALVVFGLTTNGTGRGTVVSPPHTTYCPQTDEEWSTWKLSDAESVRCSWTITPPEFLTQDPPEDR